MRSLRKLQLSSLLALLVVVGACDDNPSGPDTGVVRAEIIGLGDEVETSGTIRIVGEGVDTTVTIPAAIRSYEDDIPFGTWQIIYTPPAGYAMAAGESNDTTLVVADKGPYEIDFVVVEAEASLGVTVTGLGGGGVSGGSASVLRTDVAGQTPVTLVVPGTGSAQMSVVPGTYSVNYTAPALFTLAQGQQNPRTLNVSAGETEIATFAVVSTAATLRIQVDGVAGGAPNAGSASVLRTDIAGQTPSNVVVPTAGTLDVTVAAGTYSVTFTAPSGYTISGGANPQQATIATGATGTVSWDVEQVSTPDGLLFASAFTTALGTSVEAVTDGGKWDFNSVQRGPNPNKEIIAEGDSLDFPTANVLKVVATREDGGWSELRVSTLPIPAVGEHRYYRWYYRLIQPDNLIDNDTHPIQDGGAISASNWAFHVRNTPFQGVPAGTYAMHWTAFGEATGGNPNYRWYLGTEQQPIPLNKGETYRFEVHWFRVSATHYQLEARIYDSSDQLLYDLDDFHNANNSASLADVPSLTINNLPGQAVFNAGVNGIGDPNNDVPFPFTYAYESGFCVRTDDWCGAYNGTY